jgi:hypothetical protein
MFPTRMATKMGIKHRIATTTSNKLSEESKKKKKKLKNKTKERSLKGRA